MKNEKLNSTNIIQINNKTISFYNEVNKTLKSIDNFKNCHNRYIYESLNKVNF